VATGQLAGEALLRATQIFSRGGLAMGKGDKRTKRGKIFKGSFGKKRPKTKKMNKK
jgi:30S ribosomal protein S31